MTRMKTQNPTRQLLLEQGLALCREKGLRGIKVRELAAAAGVNLGSFVFHFGNREQFLDELVELWYAPLFDTLSQVTHDHSADTAYGRLEAVLEQMVTLVTENAAMTSQLLSDTLAGEPAAQRFALKMPWRHPKLIVDLICQAQAQGEIVAEDPRHLLLFIMMGLGMPVLLAKGPLQRCDWLPQAAAPLIAQMADADAARRRLRWLLTGIRIPRKNHE